MTSAGQAKTPSRDTECTSETFCAAISLNPMRFPSGQEPLSALQGGEGKGGNAVEARFGGKLFTKTVLQVSLDSPALAGPEGKFLRRTDLSGLEHVGGDDVL